MHVEKDVYVEMRDGVGLAVDLYHPDERTSHAALLVMTPYRKDPTVLVGPGLDVFGRTRVPAVDRGLFPLVVDVMPHYVARFVDAGFVVAVADARGTGYSEGEYDFYNLEGGPYDGYDLVEWLAAQPWCTGRVGVMGDSAMGIYAYLTALTAPPHLAALASYTHPGDFYFDQWRVGGVFRWENRIGWATLVRRNTEPLDPGDPGQPGYERKRRLYETRFRRYGHRLASGASAVELDWLTEFYRRDAYDDFWSQRSIVRRASRITIPTLHGGLWFDHFIRGTLTTHEAVDAPKLLVITPGDLATRPELGDGGLAELTVQWFSRFLLDIDNGVLDRPAARLYLMGLEDYIDEPAWPVPVAASELFLHAGPSGSVESVNDGVLSVRAPLETEATSVIDHDPAAPNITPTDVFDQRDFERRCLTFTSEPLAEDLTVIGTPFLVLYASSDAPDVDWCVRLCDVDEDGRSKLLNTGALKGSHVESHESPAPLEAGRLYRFEIEIWPIANLFRRGHRVRVDISASDFPFFEANPHPSRNRVVHDIDHPSRLVLPVKR
jgi:putative CocE/NonD family hydrolase